MAVAARYLSQHLALSHLCSRHGLFVPTSTLALSWVLPVSCPWPQARLVSCLEVLTQTLFRRTARLYNSWLGLNLPRASWQCICLRMCLESLQRRRIVSLFAGPIRIGLLEPSPRLVQYIAVVGSHRSEQAWMPHAHLPTLPQPPAGMSNQRDLGILPLSFASPSASTLTCRSCSSLPWSGSSEVWTAYTAFLCGLPFSFAVS